MSVDKVSATDEPGVTKIYPQQTGVVGCPFCHDNWKHLDIVSRPSVHVRIIRPLNPVCDGHVLVIHAEHTTSAADDPDIAAALMWAAGYYVAFHELQANIITSIGPDSTQTVFHTHLHIVPRTTGDGLALPWTGQRKAESKSPPDRSDLEFGVRGKRI